MLTICAAILACPREDVGVLLERKLPPAALTWSLPRLKRRVFSEIEGYDVGPNVANEFCKVSGMRDTWLFGDYFVPDYQRTYLLTLRRGHVHVERISDSWRPIAFRFDGKNLAGAVVYNQANRTFAGAAVCRFTGKKWECPSFQHEDRYFGVARFASANRFNVIGDLQCYGARALTEGRGVLHGEIFWRFRNGQYDPATMHLVKNATFAFDELVYGCETNNLSLQLRRCPTKAWIKALKSEIATSLRSDGCFASTARPRNKRVNFGSNGKNSLFWLVRDGDEDKVRGRIGFHFSMLAGRWQVDRIVPLN